MQAWLEDFDDERPVRGYFAHALVEAGRVLEFRGLGFGLRDLSWDVGSWALGLVWDAGLRALRFKVCLGSLL